MCHTKGKATCLIKAAVPLAAHAAMGEDYARSSSPHESKVRLSNFCCAAGCCCIWQGAGWRGGVWWRHLQYSSRSISTRSLSLSCTMRVKSTWIVRALFAAHSCWCTQSTSQEEATVGAPGR